MRPLHDSTHPTFRGLSRCCRPLWLSPSHPSQAALSRPIGKLEQAMERLRPLWPLCRMRADCRLPASQASVTHRQDGLRDATRARCRRSTAWSDRAAPTQGGASMSLPDRAQSALPKVLGPAREGGTIASRSTCRGIAMARIRRPGGLCIAAATLVARTSAAGLATPPAGGFARDRGRAPVRPPQGSPSTACDAHGAAPIARASVVLTARTLCDGLAFAHRAREALRA